MRLRQLPVTIAVGRPSRVELLVAALGLIGVVGGTLTAGWWPTPVPALLLAGSRPASPTTPAAPTAPLVVISSPAGASVLVDGHLQETAPATVALPLGPHQVVIQGADAIPESRDIQLTADGARLTVPLWRAHPLVHTLKPALPGAAIADATFLDDGRLGLIVSLPGDERQAWTLDPAHHVAIGRLGSVAPTAPLAIRPDGQAIAFLHSSTTARDAGTSAHLAELWVASFADHGGHAVWTLTDPSEELVDLAWSPHSRHLLLIGRQHPGLGAARTSLRWLDTTTNDAPLLALLPSEVVPGSSVWRADGRAVAFLVHTASLTAVCTLDDAGGFRYLGDLGHDGLAGPPIAPLAWAPDGRLAYSAIRPQDASTSGSPLGSSTPTVGLFLADPTASPGQPVVGDTGLAPFWRPDGGLFVAGLGTERTSGLRLRALDGQSQVMDVATLDVPTPNATGYGLRWDASRQRALLVTNQAAASGSHDFFLLDFGWDASS